MVEPEKCRQGQGGEGGRSEMGRNEGARRNEIQPEQFEKDGDVEAGGGVVVEKAPEESDDQGPLKQPDAQRRAEQGEEGKKKATRANQRKG